jgi:hypothetical protein
MTEEEYSAIWNAIEEARWNLGTVLEGNELIPSAEVEKSLEHIREVLAKFYSLPV